MPCQIYLFLCLSLAFTTCWQFLCHLQIRRLKWQRQDFPKLPLSEPNLLTQFWLLRPRKHCFLRRVYKSQRNSSISLLARALSGFSPERSLPGLLGKMVWDGLLTREGLSSQQASPSVKLALYSFLSPENLHCSTATAASWILRCLESTAVLPLPHLSWDAGWIISVSKARPSQWKPTRWAGEYDMASDTSWLLLIMLTYFRHAYAGQRTTCWLSLYHMGPLNVPFMSLGERRAAWLNLLIHKCLSSSEIFSFLFIEHLSSEPWVASQGLTTPPSSAHLALCSIQCNTILLILPLSRTPMINQH